MKKERTFFQQIQLAFILVVVSIALVVIAGAILNSEAEQRAKNVLLLFCLIGGGAILVVARSNRSN